MDIGAGRQGSMAGSVGICESGSYADANAGKRKPKSESFVTSPRSPLDGVALSTMARSPIYSTTAASEARALMRFKCGFVADRPFRVLGWAVGGSRPVDTKRYELPRMTTSSTPRPHHAEPENYTSVSLRSRVAFVGAFGFLDPDAADIFHDKQ
ncbi:hypothetical protein B0H12DRAFT_1328539 [Mycena haematopus]|nr:hypothetical protein B0H12DRAFT_1328539 [Mycena haematopus]